MKRSARTLHWTLALFTLGAVRCASAPAPTTPAAVTTRSIRGTVPTQIGGRPVTAVRVIDARTGRVVAQAAPNARGAFELAGVPKGATYRLSAQYGAKAAPLVFPRQQGGTAKTNLFEVGTRANPRVGSTDGPIDVGDLGATDAMGEPQLETSDPARAPNLQEDFDGDGLPDAADDDGDGLSDFAVGAFEAPSGGANRGAVSYFRGVRTAVPTTAASTLTGTVDRDTLGVSFGRLH